MRINGMNNINSVYKTNKSTKAYEAAGTGSVSSSKDEVSLSSLAKDLAVAKKAVDTTSDVRADKVAEIKAQIEAGTYNVSASEIADKIVEKAQEF